MYKDAPCTLYRSILQLYRSVLPLYRSVVPRNNNVSNAYHSNGLRTIVHMKMTYDGDRVVPKFDALGNIKCTTFFRYTKNFIVYISFNTCMYYCIHWLCVNGYNIAATPLMSQVYYSYLQTDRFYVISLHSAHVQVSHLHSTVCVRLRVCK